MSSLRLLCFSDLHLDVAAARRLASRGLAEQVDFLVSAGDLALDEQHSPELYDAFASVLRPILAVPGNHDGDALYREVIARSRWTDLDGKVVEHEGWAIGGWGIRHYDPRLSGPDRHVQAEDRALSHLIETLSQFPRERVVVVTHLPPWGLRVARDARGVDRGNAQLRRFIDAFQPAAVISGHVHHRTAVLGRAGNTTVVVPGPHGHLLRLNGA
jgi:uncharacterized protein